MMQPDEVEKPDRAGRGNEGPMPGRVLDMSNLEEEKLADGSNQLVEIRPVLYAMPELELELVVLVVVRCRSPQGGQG